MQSSQSRRSRRSRSSRRSRTRSLSRSRSGSLGGCGGVGSGSGSSCMFLLLMMMMMMMMMVMVMVMAPRMMMGHATIRDYGTAAEADDRYDGVVKSGPDVMPQFSHGLQFFQQLEAFAHVLLRGTNAM